MFLEKERRRWGGWVGVAIKKTPTPTVMSLCSVIPHFLMVMSFLMCDGSRIVTVERGWVWGFSACGYVRVRMWVFGMVKGGV